MSSLKIVIKENDKVVFSRTVSKFPILFGRGNQNHIFFPETSYLSRTHGSIGFVDSTIVIMDLNSTNGIYVDGERIATAKFSKNATFTAGNYVFEIEAVTLAPKPQPISTLAETVIDKVPRMTKLEKDVSELTIVSKRLVTVAKKLKFEFEDALADLKPEDIALQAVVTWGKDIFDVRQFQPFDFVIAGNSPFDPISVPSLKGKIKLGKYVNRKGELSIPFGLKWRLNCDGQDYDAEQAVKNRIAIATKKSVRFALQLKNVCTIDLGNNTSLHLRYVEVPRPFIPKTWIENKEVFKKAITVSLIIHLIFSMISVFSAEKVSAPEVESIPPRFAKLIFDPPKMLLATPKIEEILPPVPPPKTEVVKKEELKPESMPIPQPDSVLKPKKAIKHVAKTKPISRPMPRPQKELVEKSNTKETAVKMADSFSDMFAEVDASASKPSTSSIKIDKNIKTESLAKGVNIVGIAGALKSQIGKMQVSEGSASSVGQQVGKVGYQTGIGGVTGKRNVVSGVLGTPQLQESAIPQGINQDQVMSIVNKYLKDIHRCYERSLMDDSNLSGRIEYEWNIGPSGIVSSAKVKRSDMSNSDALSKCVIAIFYKMKFPAAKNGQPTVTTIGFPFGKL